MLKTDRKVSVHVMIEASTVQALEALAEREERSFSDVVRRMLRQALGGDGGNHGSDPAGAVHPDVATGDH